MADGIDLKVHGLEEVNKSLYSFSKKLGDTVILKALREGAKVIKKDAWRKAPKRTGRLRKNIVIKNSEIYSKRRGRGKLGVYLVLRTKGKKQNPKNAYYGRFVNDGYNVHGALLVRTGKKVRKRRIKGIISAKKPGRITAPGRSDIRGVKYINRAYKAKAAAAVRLTVAAAEKGAAIVARKTGLK